MRRIVYCPGGAEKPARVMTEDEEIAMVVVGLWHCDGATFNGEVVNLHTPQLFVLRCHYHNPFK